MSGGDAYLSWTAAAGAIYYDVYGATDGYGTYTLVGSSPTTSFVDVGAQALGRKFYKVVSICN
jgi:fibronectin type 3 domain-containing protein